LAAGELTDLKAAVKAVEIFANESFESGDWT
jgi:hypothetical protein